MREVEGLAGLGAADEAVGGLLEAVHRADRVGLLGGAEMLVDGGQETAAAVEATAGATSFGASRSRTVKALSAGSLPSANGP